jgi:hypothetical protein
LVCVSASSGGLGQHRHLLGDRCDALNDPDVDLGLALGDLAVAFAATLKESTGSSAEVSGCCLEKV